MSTNLGWYDVTQVDVKEDTLNDGAIPQSGANSWLPTALHLKRILAKVMDNRAQLRGNSQGLSINDRVKIWLDWQMTLSALKYDSASPAFSWWDIVEKGFWGGATGAPVLRPSALWIGAKLNRSTPEYLTAFGAKISEFTLKGNMTEGELELILNGMARGFSFNTTNYVQGTATRRADPPATPIIPAKDMTITIDGSDITSLIEDFALSVSRGYKKSGRADTVAASGTQIGVSGMNYREFTPGVIDATIEINLEPYGTNTQKLIDQINDKALSTCEIKTQSDTGGKKIQFTASKYTDLNQEHVSEQAPSMIRLQITSKTLNVATV